MRDMKTFLVVYDRLRAELIEIREYDSIEQALMDRLMLEIKERHRLREIEIVVLEASSLETLHKTHARYFKSARQLLEQAGAASIFQREWPAPI